MVAATATQNSQLQSPSAPQRAIMLHTLPHALLQQLSGQHSACPVKGCAGLPQREKLLLLLPRVVMFVGQAIFPGVPAVML